MYRNETKNLVKFNFSFNIINTKFDVFGDDTLILNNPGDAVITNSDQISSTYTYELYLTAELNKRYMIIKLLRSTSLLTPSMSGSGLDTPDYPSFTSVYMAETKNDNKIRIFPLTVYRESNFIKYKWTPCLIVYLSDLS